jgi:hypothetical protein
VNDNTTEIKDLRDAIKGVKDEIGELEVIGNQKMKDCNSVIDNNAKEGEMLEIEWPGNILRAGILDC